MGRDAELAHSGTAVSADGATQIAPYALPALAFGADFLFGLVGGISALRLESFVWR